MKIGNKYIVNIVLILTAVLVIFAGTAVYFLVDYKVEDIDTVEINRVYNSALKGEYVDCKYDYTYIDGGGTVIYSTVDTENMSYEMRMNEALKHGYPVKELGEGRIIFYTSYAESVNEYKHAMIITVIVISAILLIIMIAYNVYLYSRIVRPFERLRSFAGKVAEGDFTDRLNMSKYNNFGAFEEAFDIMRENLLLSQNRAKKAEEDKRQLVAEIGHDIKTPLMSIRALSERALLSKKDDTYRAIIVKTIKIENLVNDIYHGTLEEIGELGVAVCPHDISKVYDIIAVADYNGYVNMTSIIENVTVMIDPFRFTQVVENIIVNSYKYADTEIAVSAVDIGDKIRLKFKDYGAGVTEEALAHILDKFYRGERMSESNGQGLGLYISRKLMEKMGGSLSVENDRGLAVSIDILKASEK